MLDSIEKEFSAAAPPSSVLLRALERLRGVLLSPMPPGSDLPPAIVRILHLGEFLILNVDFYRVVERFSSNKPPTESFVEFMHV